MFNANKMKGSQMDQDTNSEVGIRSQFEAWVRAQGGSIRTFMNGDYKDPATDSAWEIWQAAAAALATAPSAAPVDAQTAHQHDWKPTDDLGKGFVMCECGFAKWPEGATATAHVAAAPAAPQQSPDELEVTAADLEAIRRFKLEQEGEAPEAPQQEAATVPEGWQCVLMPDGWTDAIDIAIYWAGEKEAANTKDFERLMVFWRTLASAPKHKR
jgi:hypothetical protein